MTTSKPPLTVWPVTDFTSIAERNMVNLDEAYVRKALAKQILADIDAYAMHAYDDGDRNHLGASIVGSDCSRQVYYSFRWFGGTKFSGRMQRLFQRGHLEEARYFEYLTNTGWTVWIHDPTTGKQFRVTRCNGHFGGSLDAIGKPPERYKLAADCLLLGEFKTKGTGRGFAELKEKGLMLTNAQHYDQICTYGANYGYKYAFYMSTCKNDDDMHVEIIPLDWNRAAEIEHKASYIIATREPPPRIATSPLFSKCKMCEFTGVCHEKHIPKKNCRTCVYSSPVADGEWFCSGHNAIIPGHVMISGCPKWTHIQ